MALTDITLEATNEVLISLGKIGLFLQAIGLIVIIWLGFQVANLIINYKTKKKMSKIENQLIDLKKHIDKLSKKRK